MTLIRTNEVEMSKNRLSATIVAIDTKDYYKLKQIFTYLQPKDAAWILNNLNESQRKEVAENLGSSFNPKILTMLDSKIRKHILSCLKYDTNEPKENEIKIDLEEFIQQQVFHTIKALYENDVVRLKQIFNHLQATDGAAVLEFLTPNQRFKSIRMLGSSFQPRILTFIDSSIREDIMERLDYQSLIHFLSELDYSEIVETLENVEISKQREILDSISKLIDKDMFKLIRKSLYYNEATAGRIMNPGVSFAASQTIKEAYTKFCTNNTLPKENHVLYIYDNNSETSKFKLIGQIYVSELCKLNQNKYSRIEPIYKYAVEIPCFLYTNTKFEKIAFLFKKYDMIEMPVINPKNHRLMGTINANQAINILDISIEEKFLTLVGLREFDFHDTVAETIVTRLKWLSIASCATFASVMVIKIFEDTVKTHSVLAVLMPLAPAIGGNAASQVLTVTIRALSNREIGRANLWRTIRKEVLSNFGSGIAIGSVFGIAFCILYKRFDIAIVLAISLAANITWAGLVGSALPIFLNKHDKDPAFASVFLSIITDIMGYFILLSMAKIFIH